MVGTNTYGCDDGWMLGFLSIMSDFEGGINLKNDPNYEDDIQLASHMKMLLTLTIDIYKRTILLKQFLQKKINSCT